MEIEVLSLSDLPKGEMIGIEVKGELIVLFHNEDDSVTALQDRCSHEEVKLSDGDFEEGVVTCIAHGAKFDCRSGKHLCLPAVKGVKSYPVRIKDNKIIVDI